LSYVLRKLVNNSKKSTISIQNIVVDGIFYENPTVVDAPIVLKKIPPFVPPIDTSVSFHESSDALSFTHVPPSKRKFPMPFCFIHGVAR
jgi:hypothetical protein